MHAQAPTLQAVPGLRIQRVAEDWTCSVDGVPRFTVPEGFCSDGASIPRLLWSVVGSPFDPKFSAAAIMHDWLYRKTTIARKTADNVFLRLLLANGVHRFRARLMWCGVRLFGWMFRG